MSGKNISDLKPMTGGIVPITIAERRERLEKAQRLMKENRISAVFLEPGATLFYFTGIEWGRSERMLAALLPVQGEIAYVCPAFEEERLRELMIFGKEVRVWEEHESPFALVAGVLRDRGILSGKIGIEESVRFFLADGMRRAAPHLEWVSADAVTIPCRACKSATEIALMQRANEITIE
ncbi:MAG: aminopeptidase P family protein, partial [Desulfobacteraceae bacterium]